MIDRRVTVLGPPREDGGGQPCTRCGRSAPNPGAARSGTLSGQVQQAFEVVDRLESVAEELRQALHAELSSGVERHIAAVRADAAAVIVSAHAERDLARQEADAARSALTAIRRDVARAEESAVRARHAANQAVQASRAELAEAQLDAVRAAERATADLAVAREEAAAARAERVRLAADLQAAVAERDGLRADLERAQAQLARVGERANDLADELAQLCADDDDELVATA
jgi:chromosome segregation ATPase